MKKTTKVEPWRSQAAAITVENKNKPESTLIAIISMFCHHFDLINIFKGLIWAGITRLIPATCLNTLNRLQLRFCCEDDNEVLWRRGGARVHHFLKAKTLTPLVLCFFTNPFLVSVTAFCITPSLENVFSGVNGNTGIIIINIWLPVHPVPATDLEF